MGRGMTTERTNERKEKGIYEKRGEEVNVWDEHREGEKRITNEGTKEIVPCWISTGSLHR